MSTILTTAQGAPVHNNNSSLTAGTNGPVLLQDVHLLEKLAHFNRERVPERVVHAKGAAAHGTFTVTNDMSKYTKAGLFNGVGKQTPVFLRFSTVAGELGSSDTVRDPRGFAVKFYTEEGNYDIVGNNTPIFFIRDAIKFPDFIHTQKRNPINGLKNPNAVWDFWGLSPESVHQVTILMSDRGIPATLRHMHGFGSHTFKWVNAEGQPIWVKYHFKTNQGIKNMTNEVAAELAAANPDYHTEDLYNSIANGDFPSWRVCVQLIPYEVGLERPNELFDVTKTMSQKEFPLHEVGIMELNRNPENFFAETEQVTFTPANLVPGIEVSPDKLLQGRLFAYADAHRYRVGANHAQLPINRPINQVHHHQRDGQMSFSNGTGAINYEPNSFDGTLEAVQHAPHQDQLHGTIGYYNYDNDTFSQAGILYNLFSEGEKQRTVDNIVGGLKNVERQDIVLRVINNFWQADEDYGMRIAKGLGLTLDVINTLPALHTLKQEPTIAVKETTTA